MDKKPSHRIGYFSRYVLNINAPLDALIAREVAYVVIGLDVRAQCTSFKRVKKLDSLYNRSLSEALTEVRGG